MAGVKSMAGVLGLALLLLGCVFILQGLNVLPGSYMTGDIHWTYRGAVFAVAGLAMLAWALRGGWKNVLGGLGALLAVFGIVWIALGLNILPGMGMSGHTEWARNGAIAAVLGAGLIFVAGRGGKPSAG